MCMYHVLPFTSVLWLTSFFLIEKLPLSPDFSDGSTHWTVTSLRMKVVLTSPHDWLIGLSLPRNESPLHIAWDGLTHWTVTSSGKKTSLNSPHMIDSLDRHFLGKKSRLTFTSGGSILWNVSSRARKVALTSPEMDRFIGLSLPGIKVCLTSLASDGSTHWTVTSLERNIGLTASDGSTLWTVTSRRRKIGWPLLRWIVLLYYVLCNSHIKY